MGRRKPLVVGGAILFGLAAVALAAGTAIGLAGLAPPETRIGRVQPFHAPVHANRLVETTPRNPSGGPDTGEGRPAIATPIPVPQATVEARAEEQQEHERGEHESGHEVEPDLDDD